MFRRRPPRRGSLGRRRSPSRPPLPPKARRALARARRLMDDGRFAEAAVAFERLSERAKQFDMPLRAAGLDLQAARAYLAADEVGTAQERAAEALRWLVRGGRAERVPRVLKRIETVLREKGYDAQAKQLEQEAARALEEIGLSIDEARQRVPQKTAAAPAKRGSLPGSCSGCGAPLIPDEVEWYDAHTAECLYCGTIVKAT